MPTVAASIEACPDIRSNDLPCRADPQLWDSADPFDQLDAAAGCAACPAASACLLAALRDRARGTIPQGVAVRGGVVFAPAAMPHRPLVAAAW